MKRYLLLSACLTVCTLIFAQAPAGFKYQAVARDGSGSVLVNKNVSFRISILKGALTGVSVFSERQYTQTNDFGLINLEIGQGVAETGTIEGILWGSDEFFIKVEMDPVGGESFVPMGISQLLSVPYALHARTVEQGDQWGNQVVLAGPPLEGEGTALSPLTIARQGATGGKVLKWNGTSWTPANDSLGGLILPFSGRDSAAGPAFRVTNTGGGGGILGEAANETGAGLFGLARYVGVYGTSLNETGEGIGSYGQSLSTNGYGIFGYAGADSGSTIGVRGQALSPNGKGTYGESPNIGSAGYSSALTGPGRGVLGISPSNGGTGVMGEATSPTGMNYGIYGKTSSPEGYSGYFEGGKFFIGGYVGIGKCPLAEAGALQVCGQTQAAVSARNFSSEATLYLRNDGTGEAAALITGNSQTLSAFNNSPAFYTAVLSNTGNGPVISLDAGDDFALTGTSNSSDKATIYLMNRGTGPAADLRGRIRITDGTQGAGKVLTSDSSGVASWQLPPTGVWQKNATSIYYTEGKVGIGTRSPAGQLQISSNANTGFPQLLLSENESDYSRIMFRNTAAPLKDWTIAGKSDPSDADSRLNFRYSNNLTPGSDILSITGSGELQHVRTGDAHMLPIAYGFIKSDGRIISGTGNFTCTWNPASLNYEISLPDEDYLIGSFTTVVTPEFGEQPVFSCTGSGSGQLFIYLFTPSGDRIQNDFQFIMYKP